MRVGFTYNIKKKAAFTEKEVEWDSPETIEAISDALSLNGEVVPIEADEKARRKLAMEKLNIVFNYAEGMDGEEREAFIPGILESLGIPYTGSDPATMRNCLNKATTKRILLENGIRTSDFFVVRSPGKIPEIPLPCIIKPLWEGSSKGIHNDALIMNKKMLVKKVEQILQNFNQPALVESFLPGREFTVGILGNFPDEIVLPIAEIDHSILPEELAPILSYEAKWVVDNPSNPLEILICPANLNQTLKTELESISLEAYRALGCRDWSRIDIRLDERENPNILEVNPLPGMLHKPEENSCFPASAGAAGLSFADVINEVLNSALKRYGIENFTASNKNRKAQFRKKLIYQKG